MDCVLWSGATNGCGYGQRRRAGRVVYVHRDAWEQVHGPIPAGMTIDHLCEQTLCINVEHMELVTPSENARRWWRNHPPPPKRKRKRKVDRYAQLRASEWWPG